MLARLRQKLATLQLKYHLLRHRDELWRDTWVRTRFRERYRIDVGLYSYGCFEPWRVSGPITIGRYCSFAKTARVVNANHPFDALSTHPALYEAAFGVVEHDYIAPVPMVIEDDVWVGHNAILLPGCKHIGRGAIIGAGAIVTRDVPRYAVVAGIPGRIIRQRFPDETAAAIEASRWWELDPPDLARIARQNPAALYAPDAVSLAALAKRLPTSPEPPQ